jgi:hypothetical protein
MDARVWATENRSLSLQTEITGSARAAAGSVLRRVAGVTSRTVIAGTDALMASETARAVVDRVLAGPLVERVGASIAEHDVIERAVTPSTENGALDHLVADSLTSPATERVVIEVIDSELLDEVLTRLLDVVIARLRESDELWALIDEVAQSPSVTAAISQQGMGLADQFAGVVRTRSERADDRLEGAVQRLFRRNSGDRHH